MNESCSSNILIKVYREHYEERKSTTCSLKVKLLVRKFIVYITFENIIICTIRLYLYVRKYYALLHGVSF